MRANFMSYPTDCPVRDERTPCQLDSQVYEETAMLNFDLRAFYAKWLDDIDLGGIGGRFCLDWMGDGIVLPWRHYVAYADRNVLRGPARSRSSSRSRRPLSSGRTDT